MKFSLRYLSRTIPFIILCLGAIAASASSQKGVEIQRSDIPAFYLLEPLTGLTDIQQIASQIHQSDPDAQIRQTVIKDSSLGKVVDYIHRYADLLGTQASSHLAFLVDQAFPGSGAEEPHYIRLNQIIMRKDKSFFPIVGAEILVRISPTGQLESLSSSLVPTPQHSKEEFLNFGTIIANSSEDLRRQIFEALVENPTDGFKSWVIEVTRRAPQDSKPVPPEFLADPVSFVVASRSNMNHFFSQLGYRALFRMIRDLKQHGQIQYLVQRDLPSHNRQNPNQTYAFYWRFAHPFGSTATIDVEDSPSGFRIARVLKSLPADAAEVNINMYKAGDKFPESGLFSPAESHKFSMRSSQRRNGDDDLDVAANNIAEAVNYFFDVFKWRSYDNRGAEIKVTAKVGHKDLAQNAA